MYGIFYLQQKNPATYLDTLTQGNSCPLMCVWTEVKFTQEKENMCHNLGQNILICYAN